MLGPQIDPIELTFSKVSTWQTIGLLHNYTADTLCKFTPTDELGGNGLQAWVAPFNYINHVTSIRFSHHHFSPQRTKCQSPCQKRTNKEHESAYPTILLLKTREIANITNCTAVSMGLKLERMVLIMNVSYVILQQDYIIIYN